MNFDVVKKSLEKWTLKRCLQIFFCLFGGCTLVAFALHVFYLPAGLIVGGVSGVATLLYHVTDISIPFGMLTILLNVPIFLSGAYFVSRTFFAASIIGTLSYGFFVDLWAPVFAPLHSYFFVNAKDADNLILCSIGGGALYGIGFGLILYAGFTTGGTDIIAIVIRRFRRRLSVGQVVWVLDACVVMSSALIYQIKTPGQFKLGLYSAISMICCSYCLDFILEGFNYKRVAYVISRKNQQIAEKIMEEMKRGVTALYARGMYSGQDGTVLTCVVKQEQVPMLRSIAVSIDERAFVFVVDAREVVGEGFHAGSDF